MLDELATRLDALARRVEDEWSATSPMWRDRPAGEFHDRSVQPLAQSCKDLAAASREAAAAIRAAWASRSSHD